MRIFLTNKKVLSLRNNPANFLNGLTSNTVDKSRNAFLDVHGKIVSTFDQIKLNDDFFLIIVESKAVEPLLKHIAKFAKLSKVTIELEEYSVLFDLDSEYSLKPDEFLIKQNSGQLILTRQKISSTISEEEFTLFRLQHNIPVQGIDYDNEMLLNVSETEHVSFTKGCFLGQELVAKVHNRSKPSWKLIVKYEDDQSLEVRQPMTSRVSDPKTNRVFGFAFVKND